MARRPKDKSVLELARAELARRRDRLDLKVACERDLMKFVETFWSVIEPSTALVKGWVLEMMADVFMAAADGHLTRIILNVPPGSMKSTMLNVMLPAWLWGPQSKPQLRFICASFSRDVPERDNIRLLRVIGSDLYREFWGDRFRITRESTPLIETSATGWKRLGSTGSGITGQRADWLLLDDLNDPRNVESDAVRQETNHWLTEVMPDRINDLRKSVIVNVQQRTHEMDATGTLLKYGYEQIVVPLEFDASLFREVVLRRNAKGEPTMVWADPRGLDKDGRVLPGLVVRPSGELEAEAGSPMARAEGLNCWPERFPPEVMDAMRAQKGPYAWAAQYGQRPTVRGGAIIRREWWRRWRGSVFPEFGTLVASLDTAVKEGADNDFNALTVLGAFAGDDGSPQLMLADAWRVRTSLADLVRMVAETCRRMKVDYLLVEDKARGHDVAAEIRRQYANAPWITVLLKIGGGRHAPDKVTRVMAVSPMFSGAVRRDAATDTDVWEGGMVWAPETDFAEEVIAETTSFPRGAFDDYVDSLSQSLLWLRRNGMALTKAEFREAEEDALLFKKPAAVPYAQFGFAA